MQRVLVIGSGGAGKSTLARQIGRQLDLPVIHLDQHYWKPGWVETPPSEWTKIVETLIEEDDWVIDGNYGGTMDQRIARADTVVFLDISRVICLWRAIKRRIEYHGKSRPDITPGCSEMIELEYVKWIWTYPTTRRPAILEKLSSLDNEKNIVILSTSRDVDRFRSYLESISL